MLLFVPSSNPFYVNPFGGTGPVRVAYNFLDDLGPSKQEGSVNTIVGVLGSNYRLPSDWRATLSGSYGRDRTHARLDQLNSGAINAALADDQPETAFNPFGEGSNTNPATLAGFITDQVEAYQSHIWLADVIADGSLFSIGRGVARLALGGQYRQEALRQTGATSDLERDVTAGFGELVIPVLMAEDAGRTVPILEMSIAGRYDQYSDFGGALSPKAALSFRPMTGLGFRATWGTSFKPPTLTDLGEAESIALFPAPDPLNPAGFSIALVRQGGNDSLKEERAKSWTVGVDLQHEGSLGRFAISASYYDIRYKDRVATPTVNPLEAPSIWGMTITRPPTAQQLVELCPQSVFGDCASTPPDVVLDFRALNLAVLNTNGVDLSVSNTARLAGGDLTATLNANYVLSYEQAITSSAPADSVLNVLGNPIDLRLRATATWKRNRLALNAGANYSDGYHEAPGPAPRRIDSWTAVDAGASYEFEGGEFLHGLELSLQAANLFDEDPPFVNVSLGFDAANASPLGRRLSVALRKHW